MSATQHLKIHAAALVVALLLTMQPAHAVDDPMVRIEITRDIPHDQTYTIVREFADMDELTMWFVNKMETAGCDPYVTKVELFPLGKEAHRE